MSNLFLNKNINITAVKQKKMRMMNIRTKEND